MSTFRNLSKQLGGYVNLQKFKLVNGWQCQSTENKSDKEKGTPNLRAKTLIMRETSTGQRQENNSLCDKIGTKYYSSIILT